MKPKEEITTDVESEEVIHEVEPGDVCKPGDTDCLRRLISAFSDCD